MQTENTVSVDEHSVVKRLPKILITGFLTLLPLSATVAIVAVVVSFAYEWVGPSSRFGKMLSAVGFGAGESQILGYLVGLGFVLLAIFAVGLMVELGLKKWIKTTSELIVGKIPVVGTVYETVGNFVSVLSDGEKGKMKGMSPVWCSFGPPPSPMVLGLLTSPEVVVIAGVKYRPVIIPTAPVPIGGGLLFLPEERVQQASGVGIEGLTSIYVSMGATVPQFVLPTERTSQKGD